MIPPLFLEIFFIVYGFSQKTLDAQTDFSLKIDLVENDDFLRIFALFLVGQGNRSKNPKMGNFYIVNQAQHKKGPTIPVIFFKKVINMLRSY